MPAMSLKNATRLTPTLAFPVAILVAACASSSHVSPSPSPSPSSASASSPSLVMPSPTIAPAVLPAGWMYVTLIDPSLEIGVPGAWTKGDPSATADPTYTASQPPAEQKVIRFGDAMASSGKTRLVSSGPLDPTAGTTADYGFVVVFVETGDASLSSFADREVQLDTGLGLGPIERSSVVLPAGASIRLAYSAQLGDASTAFSEVDYLFFLVDGRSLTVAASTGTSQGARASVDALAASVIATLRLPNAGSSGPAPATTPPSQVGSWTKSARETTCDEYLGQMTEDQRQRMAKALFEDLWTSGGKSTTPTSDMVAAFTKALEPICGANRTHSVYLTGAGIVAMMLYG